MLQSGNDLVLRSGGCLVLMIMESEDLRYASTRVNRDCVSSNVRTVKPMTRLIRVLADLIAASHNPPKSGLMGGMNFQVMIWFISF